MGIITILDTQTSNMIAAGEVVDRPASAIKELIENAIDAKATVITVEIRGGGNALIRVSDNGSGIDRDDLPKTILRHATSKIKTADEIDGVKTLGFRGEALAAISSVSHFEIISKKKDNDYGYVLSVEDGETTLEETGCPDGTTIIVRELFYNVPARRKFLKRDATEASAAAAVTEKAAFSHPEISFKFINDGETKFQSPGNNDLRSTVFAICGKDFADSLIPVEYTSEGLCVSGLISKPEKVRGSRAAQNFFVNNRFVRSKTVMAALEEAYSSYIASGKFPACVLFVDVPHTSVDVNVHPAKLEIKFSDEKKIFSTVYAAVRNALTKMMVQGEDDIFTDTSEEEKKEPFVAPKPTPRPVNTHTGSMPAYMVRTPKPIVPGYEVFKPQIDDDAPVSTPSVNGEAKLEQSHAGNASVPFFEEVHTLDITPPQREEEPKQPEAVQETFEQPAPAQEVPEQSEAIQQTFEQTVIIEEEKAPKVNYRIIGEAYNSYIFVQYDNEIQIIDKHAAHERLLYEKLRTKNTVVIQELLEGITVKLTSSETDLILQNAEYLADYGFIVEQFGDNTVIIRAVPAVISNLSHLDEILQSFADSLAIGDTLPFEKRCDRALYTMACKAAIKAGQITHYEDSEWLVEQMLQNPEVKYCPHGRPIAKSLTKRELEKFFDR